MDGLFHRRMRFDGQPGYEQIQINNGQIMVCQWLPADADLTGNNLVSFDQFEQIKDKIYRKES